MPAEAWNESALESWHKSDNELLNEFSQPKQLLNRCVIWDGISLYGAELDGVWQDKVKQK